ncbi:MAG: hypothetical protein RLZZ507_4379 [Cyanobacteriota bacterium]|jgi:hypothetical protein
MTKNVIKKSDYEFTISFSDLPDELNLNFKPLVESFNLHLLYNKFVLCHWQARPKGLRGFGWYDFLSKKYYSIDWNNIKVESKSIPIQVNEIEFPTALPSAVLLFPDSYLVKKTNYWKLTDE